MGRKKALSTNHRRRSLASIRTATAAPEGEEHQRAKGTYNRSPGLQRTGLGLTAVLGQEVAKNFGL